MSEESSVHLSTDPLTKQVGGSHYKSCGIQPVEYIHANDLNYFEGNVIKYITRHRTKGDGRKDIEKVIHYAELILQLEYGDKDSQLIFNLSNKKGIV
jgi:hypothetical protein|tara:strand:- start:2638 stop:2928 length:291 start_codon:yes stop_codon:yes gene_type:complete